MRNLKTAEHLTTMNNLSDSAVESGCEGESQGYFQRYLTDTSPFDAHQEEEENEDVFGSGVCMLYSCSLSLCLSLCLSFSLSVSLSLSLSLSVYLC